MDKPDAISRWVCDSVVLAPMADQLIKSAMYCGVFGSNASVAIGKPILVISSNNLRAFLSPCSISNELSICGSFIIPFQPTVVLGFSK